MSRVASSQRLIRRLVVRLSAMPSRTRTVANSAKDFEFAPVVVRSGRSLRTSSVASSADGTETAGASAVLGAGGAVVATSGMVVDGAVVVVGGISAHWANKVTFSAGIANDAPAERTVPEPFAEVFHPEKVYPVRVGATDDTVTVDAN